ncbi:MAG: hypothetical protein FJX90_02070 [Bacteroidetes bacterium]|nr:hypothetical protein [Bacteroidota bacterium]
MTQSENNNLQSSNLLVLVYKWRKQLIGLTLIAALLAAGASFLIEEKYKSTVVLFASQQHSFGEQLLEDVKKQDLLAYGEEEDAERLMQIINSDQIRSRIIEKYNLWQVYEIKKEDRGANTLIGKLYADNVAANLTRFGSIEITVMDASPERARDMANDIAALTDSVSNKMRSERAMTAFLYAKSSLEALQIEIKTLEDSMQQLQRRGVYSYKDQIAYLTEQYGTAIAEGHPDRAQEIKDQMDFLSQYGTQYKKLESEIDGGYEKMQVLRKRFDLMKIDVESRLSSQLVVDKAAAADKKSYPVRWLIVVISAISAFVFGVAAILVRENLHLLKKFD